MSSGSGASLRNRRILSVLLLAALVRCYSERQRETCPGKQDDAPCSEAE